MIDVLINSSTLIGIIGVTLILLSYYLLNINRLSSKSWFYLWLNLIGSLLILFSLLFHWNLPSVVIELAWILISLLGMYRAYRGMN